MSPELFGQLAAAFVIAWGAVSAIRASRSTSRTNLIGSLLVALGMLLITRLIADFGGWTGWFIYLWLICLAGYVFAVYRAATVWPNLPSRADDASSRAGETTTLWIASVLALAVAGAMVIPGLMLG